MKNEDKKSAIIINIGDELLAGHTVNTNATWMSAELRDIGVNVTKHVVVADEKDAIVCALDQVDESISYVFITGGLGPTEDDRTKAVITHYFGGNLVFSEEVFAEVKEFFAKRGRVPSQSNRSQAIIPDNAERIVNTMGTASGMIFNKNGVKYYVMPGVPYEMKTMMRDHILPEIAKHSELTEQVFQVNTFALPESEIADKISDELAAELKEVKIGYYPSPRGITIRLLARNSILAKKIQMKIVEMFTKHVYSIEGEALEDVFVKKCIEKKLTVSCAESCTGGKMCDMITSVPGSSAILNESYITYSNEAKHRLLGVPENILQEFGAVSQETVEAMLNGLWDKTGADICLAASGIAGPGGGSVEKPVGLVYIGAKYKNIIKIHKLTYDRGREKNKEYAARAALDLARLLISEGKNYV